MNTLNLPQLDKQDVYVNDPKENARDPNENAKDPNANAKDPNANAKDPNANAKDPNENSDEISAKSGGNDHDQEEIVEEVDPYPLPSNQDYLSYYVYQNEWRPTKPLGPIGAMWNNPGPGIVLPPTIGEEGHDPTKWKAPGYTMGAKDRRGANQDQAVYPGPVKYDTRGLTNQGKDRAKGPTFGRAPRFPTRNKESHKLPGPASYDRLEGDRHVYHRGPTFAMPKAQRTGGFVGGTTPAPNAYSLPPAFGPGKTPLSQAPAYSMGEAKRGEIYSKSMGPGPTEYMLPPTDWYMSKSPAFHMGSKAHPPTADTSHKSKDRRLPAAHLVKFNKPSGPRHTFGIRHSPYIVLPGFAAEK